MKIEWRNGIVYLPALLVVLALKQHYSTASVEALRWILAPTAALVAAVRGASFVFETHAGYVNRELHYVIAESCAGVNFMIVVFCASILAYTRYTRTDRQRLLLFVGGLLFSFLAAIAANSIRILIALPLHLNAVSWGWWTPERIHRLEGTVVYLTVLCLLFISSRWMVMRCANPR